MKAEMAKLADLVDMNDNRAIYEEVKTIILMMDSEFNLEHLTEAFAEVEKLFSGRYPGYDINFSRYYDFSSTATVLLAMSRLMHGAVIDGRKFSSKEINIALAGTLMCTSGFIAERQHPVDGSSPLIEEQIKMSIEFIKSYIRRHPYFSNADRQFEEILLSTLSTAEAEKIAFSGEQSRLLGKMLGAADVLGRMAERYYLERLIFLYHEFEKKDCKRFANELDLLNGAVDYYKIMGYKLSEELQDINRYMVNHFRTRWGVDKNLYWTTIERSIAYLQLIIARTEAERKDYLRRKVPSA